MKIVINDCFGGFSVDEKVAERMGYSRFDTRCDEIRTEPSLIEAIENGENCNGFCARLIVVEIPEEATDFEIVEYDGLEHIIAVVDGKLVHISE